MPSLTRVPQTSSTSISTDVADEEALAGAAAHYQHVASSSWRSRGNQRMPVGVSGLRLNGLNADATLEIHHDGGQQIDGGIGTGLRRRRRPARRRACPFRCAAVCGREGRSAARSSSARRSLYCGSAARMGIRIKQSLGSGDALHEDKRMGGGALQEDEGVLVLEPGHAEGNSKTASGGYSTCPKHLV